MASLSSAFCIEKKNLLLVYFLAILSFKFSVYFISVKMKILLAHLLTMLLFTFFTPGEVADFLQYAYCIYHLF